MKRAYEVIDGATGEIRSVAVRQPEAAALTVPDDKIELLKRTIARGVTDDELDLFIAVCNRTGLNPFAKQIYAISRYDGKLQRNVMAIQVGIDGLRLQARRSRDFAGEDGPYWCGEDGQWRDVWLSDEPPAAAKVGVRRRGDSVFTYGVTTYREYCQRTREGKPMGLWLTMPANQLAKTAEAQALRKLFPAETAQLQIDEEIDAADLEYHQTGEHVAEVMAAVEARTGKKTHELAWGQDEYVDGTPVVRQGQTFAGAANVVAAESPAESTSESATSDEPPNQEVFVPCNEGQQKALLQLANKMSTPPSVRKQIEECDWAKLSFNDALDWIASLKS